MTDFTRKWQEIEAAFDRDEELEADEFLQQQASQHQLPPGALDEVAGELLRQAFGEHQLPEGLRLSKYRIRERLEVGGQSEIYLAERSDGIFSRTVVIKFIAADYSRELLKQQFLKEMQLLADLNHPGIVNMLDGGMTDEGQPWLVLDYVPGIRLNDYCSVEKPDLRTIVSLFIRLCEALSYIHLREVVHLDLKPANVLVRDLNGVPYPVIIDFGIALQTASVAGGDTSTRFGTRGYAAPEQVAGQKPDHRADLYALGMMLAQLLVRDSGQSVGLMEPAERERQLRRSLVPPDLRRIIRRCTTTEPSARYSDADALRTDLNNWLRDLPLLENRNRPMHVLAKWVERHKWISALLLLAMLTGLGFGWKYTHDIRLLQQATLAEKRAGEALNNFMLTDLFDRLKRIGRIDLLEDVSARSLRHLQRQDSRALSPEEQLQSAIANINVGRVMDALQLTGPALESFGRAEAHLANLQGLPGMQVAVLEQSARLQEYKSETLATEGQYEQTEQALLAAIRYSKDYLQQVPAGDRQILWESYLQLGWHYMDYDQPEHAEQALETAMDLAQVQLKETGNKQWKLNLSHSHQAMAWLGFDYGNASQAPLEIARALELAEQTTTGDIEDIEYLDNYRILLNQQAFFQLEEDELAGAESVLSRALELGQQLQWMAPQNREYQRELAYTHTSLAELAEIRGDDAMALHHYLDGLEISRAIYQADTRDYSSASDLAIDLTGAAAALQRSGESQKARELLEEAVATMLPVQKAEPTNKYYVYTLAVPLIRLQRYAEARPLVEAIRNTGMEDDAFRELLSQHALD
jgi:tRNA A-37 threonylcarbamoyl transferase component Bud32/tetratricopeptide (TPR) repeat protein